MQREAGTRSCGSCHEDVFYIKRKRNCFRVSVQKYRVMAFFSDSFSKIIKSLGVVFGDIGTSPIYTIGAILLFILPTVENILGLLSLIVWSLIIVITVQYAWLAMYLGSKGKGGTTGSSIPVLICADVRACPYLWKQVPRILCFWLRTSVLLPAVRHSTIR